MSYPKELGPDPEPSPRVHLGRLFDKTRNHLGRLISDMDSGERKPITEQHHFMFHDMTSGVLADVSYEKYTMPQMLTEARLTASSEHPVIIVTEPLVNQRADKRYLVSQIVFDPRISQEPSIRTSVVLRQASRINPSEPFFQVDANLIRPYDRHEKYPSGTEIFVLSSADHEDAVREEMFASDIADDFNKISKLSKELASVLDLIDRLYP